MTLRSANWRRPLVAACVCFALAAMGLVLLRTLPYSTSFILPVDSARLAASPHDPPPTSHALSGEAIRFWHPGFATDPLFAPFRERFNEGCAGTRGIDAGRCVSDLLARAFPYGAPPREFVDDDFKPSRHMNRHFGGVAGHCTTRSSLGAALLLANGTPARVVQLLPREGLGHNVFEVWDSRFGWVLFDPSFGVMLRSRDGLPLSAIAAQGLSLGEADWEQVARTPEHTRSDDLQPARVLADADLLFPEPWLYLRSGERHAPWPFRATFVRVGPGYWEHGPLQWLVRCAVLLALLAGTIASVITARSLLRRNASGAAAGPDAHASVRMSAQGR